ncbi:MAG: DUF1573 domain-containing protein [Ignavibacteria bacterium]
MNPLNKVKKISFFVFGLILVFSFSAFLISKNLKDPRISGPVITFEEEKHDFGDVKQGPALENYFEFTNTGEDVLIVKSVTTSCGCTGAMIGDKKEFLPGEKGKVKVTFNTEGRSGINEKTITVESNDARNPRKTLSIKCNIIPAN